MSIPSRKLPMSQAYETVFPTEESDSYDGYGIIFNTSMLSSIILQFEESGDVMYSPLSYTGNRERIL